MDKTSSAAMVAESIQYRTLRLRSISRYLDIYDFTGIWNTVCESERARFLTLANEYNSKGIINWLRDASDKHMELWTITKLRIYAGSVGIKNTCRKTRAEILKEINDAKSRLP